MTLHAKLRKALRGEFKLIHFETLANGTIYGVVTSPSFLGQDDRTRQQRLDDVLRLALSAGELQSIAILVTLTPAEHVSIAADAA